VAGLTALVLVMVNQGSPSPWEGCVILALMFTGTLIYRAQQRQPGFGRPATAAIVAGVLALTTFAGIWHGRQLHYSHQWQVQWATSVLLAGATFGLGLALSGRRVPRWCAWLGMISFSVYLLHPLVFDAYRSVPALHRRHTMPDQVLLFAGCVAVIIALSAATYYLVEKPMQQLGRRLAGRGAGRAGDSGGAGNTGTGTGEPALGSAVTSGPETGEPAGIVVGSSVEQAVEPEQPLPPSDEARRPAGDGTGAPSRAGDGPAEARVRSGSGRDTASARPGAPMATS